MAVTKPSWLKSWLSRLNWDDFTWKIYIGDAIEDGLDWALEWVNWGIDQATSAYNKAWDAYYYAIDVYKDLRKVIYQETNDLWDRAFAWWSELTDWWADKRQDVWAWIDDVKDWAWDRIDDVWQFISDLNDAWESFRKSILPKLLDTTWLRNFFGRQVDNISDWWLAKRQEIDDWVDATTKPIRDELNKYLDTLSSAKQLFSDPLAWPDHFARWVLNWIESIIARIW